LTISRKQQLLLFELAINSGDFYVLFQRKNHFINKRLQKPRRLNFKCMAAVNNVNKTNGNRYNSKVCQFHVLLPTETVIVAHPVYISFA
jgi:hypothetical protein